MSDVAGVFLTSIFGWSGLHALFDQFLDSVQIVLSNSKFIVIFAKSPFLKGLFEGVLKSTPFVKAKYV